MPEDARLWVGHSFGGRLVLELAHARPDRVERGVLLDPAIWVPPPYALERAEATRADASWASLEEAVEARLADGTLDGAPRELVRADYEAHLDPGADGRLRLRFNRSAVIAAYSEMARTPPQERLVVPLLAVRALHADVCPEVLLDAYAATVGPQLETATLATGHIVMWDDLDGTVAAIESFLSR